MTSDCSNLADKRLNDIVGSAYYVAPEVLQRSYGTEADMWSIGVIAYVLLCGSRPFWARTESGIFRTVLKADLSFDDDPWPSLSSDAKDFVKGLLHKDHLKRLTAAQALCKFIELKSTLYRRRTKLLNFSNASSPNFVFTGHPWLANHPDVKIPLDMIVYKLVRAYIYSSSLRRLALNVSALKIYLILLSLYILF